MSQSEAEPLDCRVLYHSMGKNSRKIEEFLCNMCKFFAVRSLARHNAPRCVWRSFFLIRERTNQERGLRGLIPLRTPQCEKVAALRSAHFFAKASIFSFCVGVLKKNANTEAARKRNNKSFCQLRRTPVQLNFKQKRLCVLRLPLVMARRRAVY